MTPLKSVENVGSLRQSPMSAISFSLRWLLTTSLLTSLVSDGKNRTCVSHLRTFPKERPFCISANLIRIDPLYLITSSFLPFEERCRSHQVFPCCQNIDLLSASVLAVSRTFKQCRTNHNGWWMVGHPAAH